MGGCLVATLFSKHMQPQSYNSEHFSQFLGSCLVATLYNMDSLQFNSMQMKRPSILERPLILHLIEDEVS